MASVIQNHNTTYLKIPLLQQQMNAAVANSLIAD